MNDISIMISLKNLLPALVAGLQDLDFDRLLSVVASLIFVGAFILQFVSIYRHRGRDAVVSMMTWVLVACLCAAVAGYYWQQQRDFFQVVLLLILTGGALSCFLISIISRNTLEEEVERRKVDDTADGSIEAQIEHTATAIRERFALARQRKVA